MFPSQVIDVTRLFSTSLVVVGLGGGCGASSFQYVAWSMGHLGRNELMVMVVEMGWVGVGEGKG